MTRPPLHSIQEIVAMLTACIDQLARDLLPHGRRLGREWVCGGLDGRGLSVCLSGAKQGVWAEFSTGLTGDPLDLVARAKCGGDAGEALKWACGWLGLSNEGARTAAPMPPMPPMPRVDHAAEAEKRRQRGARLFGEALPRAFGGQSAHRRAGATPQPYGAYGPVPPKRRRRRVVP